jgi:hypothetical protein
MGATGAAADDAGHAIATIVVTRAAANGGSHACDALLAQLHASVARRPADRGARDDAQVRAT